MIESIHVGDDLGITLTLYDDAGEVVPLDGFAIEAVAALKDVAIAANVQIVDSANGVASLTWDDAGFTEGIWSVYVRATKAGTRQHIAADTVEVLSTAF